MMLITGIVFLSVFTVFLPVETCVASGNTIYVDADNTEGPWDGTQAHPYQDIQAGINAANESGGDTVYVYSGTYYENIEIDRSLTMTGEGSGTKNIIGADSNKNTIVISVDNVYIAGFTVDNNVGKTNHYHCIFLNSVSGCTITNNIIEKGEYGLYLLSSDGNTINGNTLQNNNQKGIRLSNSNSNTIQGNVIQNIGDGVYLLSSNSNEIYQNDIKGNARGLWLHSSNNNIIYKNDFSDNIGDNAYDTGSNSWNYNSQGNYWDDYTGKDEDNNGIGDTPYDIPGGSNQDLYPLVNQKPVATIDSVTPNPATEGQTVSFSGHGEDYDGDITGYNWRSTMDGQLSTQASFSTSSLSVGTHTIYFKVKDDDNEWSITEATVVLVINSQSGQENQKPTAEIKSITPITAIEGDSIYFHGIGQDPDGMVVEYSWRSNIEDGILSSESTFSKSDLKTGLHVIYFKVKDNDGEWSDEVSKNIIVNPSSSTNEQPKADAGGPYSGYVNETITFDGSGSSDDGTLIDYSWDFGDETSGAGESSTHTYTSVGNYTISLTVTDNEGATSSDTTYANITIQASNQNGDGEEDGGSPGFEIIFVIIASVIVLFWIKKRKGS